MLLVFLRTLGERSLQHDKDLYICFIDYEKAFNRVNWYKLMATLSVDWLARQTTDVQVVYESVGCHKNKQPPSTLMHVSWAEELDRAAHCLHPL